MSKQKKPLIQQAKIRSIKEREDGLCEYVLIFRGMSPVTGLYNGTIDEAREYLETSLKRINGPKYDLRHTEEAWNESA